MDAGFGNSLAGDGVALIAVLAATGVFLLSRRLLRRWGGSSAHHRIADLEARLNEAETALAAEAHVLVIWRGKAVLPDRVLGSMHGAATLPGSHRARFEAGALDFCHIATPAVAEVSGHYHPKARIGLSGGSLSRPCFLIDRARVILPAFGTYTGGLSCTDPALAGLMGSGALAVLTGSRAHALPMPRSPRSRKESA